MHTPIHTYMISICLRMQRSEWRRGQQSSKQIDKQQKEQIHICVCVCMCACSSTYLLFSGCPTDVLPNNCGRRWITALRRLPAKNPLIVSHHQAGFAAFAFLLHAGVANGYKNSRVCVCAAICLAYGGRSTYFSCDYFMTANN